MTRRSRREIETELDGLSDRGTTESADPMLLFKDRHGDLYRSEDCTGDPVNPEALDGAPVMILEVSEEVVMTREKAEREGREVLGPATDTPPGRDAVRVRWSE
jgi:hypothetical protein